MQCVCRFGCTVGAFPQGGFAIGVADVLTVAWAELTALIGWGDVWWSRVVFMIIVAFHTTADAFGFEEIAKRCGLEGVWALSRGAFRLVAVLLGLSNRVRWKSFSGSSSNRDSNAKGYTNNEDPECYRPKAR